MNDKGHDETEKVLKEIENQISKEYAQAEKEISAKLDDYLEKFRAKDELKRKALENGLITEQEYKKWRVGQIMMGQRWAEMRDTIAKDLTNADKIARSIAFEHMPYVYAINHDYGTFQVEKASKLDTSYTLYDRNAMEQLVKNEDTFIPAPGRKVTRDIKEGKALAWNKKQVQSAMMQSLLQGESIGKIATRLSKSVGESDRKAAIRNARTMTTGVENAGRVESYRQANEMGIHTQKQWLATLDSRTRHWHADLDGVAVDNDEPFENEIGQIMFPGDPTADPANIYNCRCTLIASIKGFERDVSDMNLRHDDHLGNMSYDEWKKGHYDQTSDPITKQDTISEIMEWKHKAEYERIKNSKPADIETPVDKEGRTRYNPRTKEELEEVASKLKSFAEDYSNKPSKWSGNIRVNNLLLQKGAHGAKEWNCDISLISQTDDGTVLHELLHSCSASYYDEDVFINNQYIEEGTVEYLTELICEENGIEYHRTYEKQTDVLDSLWEALGYNNGKDFAQEIFNVPLPKRYKWLENKTIKKLEETHASKKDYDDTLSYIGALKGGEYVK